MSFGTHPQFTFLDAVLSIMFWAHTPAPSYKYVPRNGRLHWVNRLPCDTSFMMLRCLRFRWFASRLQICWWRLSISIILHKLCTGQALFSKGHSQSRMPTFGAKTHWRAPGFDYHVQHGRLEFPLVYGQIGNDREWKELQIPMKQQTVFLSFVHFISDRLFL